jgi:hypothetical protein
LLAFGGIVVTLISHLSGEQDLKEHPIAALICAFLFIGPIARDVLWRVFRVGRRIYRERTHVGFREPVDTLAVLLLGGIFVWGLCGWIAYESSPHFSGRLNARSIRVVPGEVVGISNCLVVLFESVAITNTGRSGNITRWELHIHTLGGQEFVGYDDLIVDRNHEGKDFIFITAAHVDKNQTVHGYAAFIVGMVRRQAVEVPGTKWEIAFWDADSKRYEIKGDIGAQK